MITYQRTEEDKPQRVDEKGYLPDGTQVIFFPDDHTQVFGTGIFNMSDEGNCTDVCYQGADHE